MNLLNNGLKLIKGLAIHWVVEAHDEWRVTLLFTEPDIKILARLKFTKDRRYNRLTLDWRIL